MEGMDGIECPIEEGVGGGGKCDPSISIPRGRPIYVSNMVTSCTRVPNFLHSLLSELQNLDVELREDSSHHDDDISVDDLKVKVFTEDELMDMALKQVFEGRENNENHPPLLNQSNAGCLEKNSRRKRHGTNNSILDSSCVKGGESCENQTEARGRQGSSQTSFI